MRLIPLMVLLIGASYNQDMHTRLRQANRLRKRILRAGGSVRPQVRPVKLKAGDIQRMVLLVLERSDSPLHVQEVHSLVEERLRRPVSRDTVRSCLTEGIRLKRFGLRRVAYATYCLDTSEVQKCSGPYDDRQAASSLESKRSNSSG